MSGQVNGASTTVAIRRSVILSCEGAELRLTLCVAASRSASVTSVVAAAPAAAVAADLKKARRSSRRRTAGFMRDLFSGRSICEGSPLSRRGRERISGREDGEQREDEGEGDEREPCAAMERDGFAPRRVWRVGWALAGGRLGGDRRHPVGGETPGPEPDRGEHRPRPRENAGHRGRGAARAVGKSAPEIHRRAEPA